MHECPECSQACCCDQDDLWTEDNSACRCDCEWARDQGWDDIGDAVEDYEGADDGCCLGSACLNPHPDHFAYECFSAEMARDAGEGHQTDADVERLARRNTRIAAAVFLAALPVTLPLTVAGVVGFRVVFGWWIWQEPWSGPRYR